jgi:hypothetical protein
MDGGLMSQHYVLRDVTPKDFEFLYALHEQTMKPYVDRTWGWNDADQLARFRDGFDPTRVRIICSEGDDIGVVAFEHGLKATVISNIEISPAWQRRGIRHAAD